MKRDFDLIRSILLQVEAAPAGCPIDSFTLPDGADAAIFTEHLQLLFDEEMIEGEIFASGDGPVIDVRRLTWKGHDFLDAVRSDTIWKKAKEQLSKVGGSASLEIFKALLSQLVKAQLSLPTQ